MRAFPCRVRLRTGAVQAGISAEASRPGDGDHSRAQPQAPYPGRVTLTLDPSTASGFAWTSPQAAEVNVTPGTLAEVEVEVSRRPPVALIVPWIREGLGL